MPGIDRGGRLWVRGPNVMLGYFRIGALEPLEDGWHDTGDIVDVDAEGYVSIVGRAKRFAKIGGEMVSMTAAEALAAELWPGAKHAVLAVPDPRNGEALVLLTTQLGADRRALHDHARSRGVTEIFVPRSLRVIGAMPLLGTGKTDYPAVQRMLLPAENLKLEPEAAN